MVLVSFLLHCIFLFLRFDLAFCFFAILLLLMCFWRGVFSSEEEKGSLVLRGCIRRCVFFSAPLPSSFILMRSVCCGLSLASSACSQLGAGRLHGRDPVGVRNRGRWRCEGPSNGLWGVSDGKKTCLCFHESGRIDDIGTAWHGMACSPCMFGTTTPTPTPRSGRPPVSVFRWTLLVFWLDGWVGFCFGFCDEALRGGERGWWE